VDQGKNPDQYMKSFIEQTALENQFTFGILSAMTVRLNYSPLIKFSGSLIYDTRIIAMI